MCAMERRLYFLGDLDASYPIEIAELAVFRGLDNDLAFCGGLPVF